MLTARVNVPAGADLAKTATLVERACRLQQLRVRQRTTLKSYPGSIHWHFELKGESGTLEVTFWPEGRSIWISVHVNREGTWTTKAMRELRAELEGRLTNG